jgi:hypothetical protein
MNRIPRALIVSCVVLAGPGISRAQHFDVLTQQVNGQLVTGTTDYDTAQWYLGRRVFHRDFDSDFAINNPGFNSIGAGSPDMPAGAQALPGNTDLSWDFLPMTTNNLSQNLFYWNGQDTDGVPGLTPSDVVFGPLPGPSYTLSLFDKSNAKHSVNGANAFVPGGVIDSTAADGSMHKHRVFFLEDGDGNSGTLPTDGIYLLATQLRMTGLSNSLPVFIIFGTPGSSVAAEDDAAVPWVEQQLDLPGDFNHNGAVDAADYVVWRKGLSTMTYAPADYNVWRAHFGQIAQLIVNAGSGMGSSGSLGAGTVPEPAIELLLLMATIALALKHNDRRLHGRGHRGTKNIHSTFRCAF